MRRRPFLRYWLAGLACALGPLAVAAGLALAYAPALPLASPLLPPLLWLLFGLALAAGLLLAVVAAWLLASQDAASPYSTETTPEPNQELLAEQVTALALELAEAESAAQVGALAAGRVLALLGAQQAALYAVDMLSQRLRLLAAAGETPAPEEAAFGEGLAGQTAAQGERVTWPEGEGEAGPGDGLGVPMRWQGQLLGVLCAQRAGGPAWTTAEIQAAEQAAALAGAALGRLRVMDTSAEQARRLAVVQAALQAAFGAGEPERALSAAVANLHRHGRFDRLGLYVRDAAGGLRLHTCCHAPGADGPHAERLALGEGLVGRVAADGRVRRTPAAGVDGLGPLAHPDAGAAVCVPLLFEQQVVGVLNAESGELQSNSLKPTALPFAGDEHLLRLAAGLLAPLVASARREADDRAHLDEFSLLTEIAQAAVAGEPQGGSPAVVDDSLTRAVHVLKRRLGYDIIGFGLLTEDGTLVQPHHSYQGVALQGPHRRLPVTQGLVGVAVRTGQAVRVDDVRQHPDYVAVLPDVRSELVVPLKVADRVIGVLNTESRRLAAYTERDEQLLTIVAGLPAPIIENARLRARAEQQAEQMRLVNDIGRDVVGILEVDSLLAQVCQRLEQAFDFYHAGLGLIEDKYVVFTRHWDARHNVMLPEARVPLGGPGPVAWAARTGQPRYVPDVRRDPDFLPQPLLPETRAQAAVPLVVQGRTVGVLDVHSSRVGDFGPDQAAALEAISGQVAVAIENARLFAEARQRAAEVTALLTTTLAVGSSLDLDARLQSVAVHARQLVEADACTIYRLSPDGQQLLPVVALDELYAKEILSDVVPVGEGIIGYVAVSGEGEVVNRVDLDPRAKQIPGTPLTPESLIAIPLAAGDRLIGVMAVYREGTREFTAHHFDLLQSFGAQAAVALENAELYQKLRERAEWLQHTYDELAEADRVKDEMVQNISHELRTPLTFLRSYVDLLLGGDLGPLQPEQERSLRVIKDKTDSLARLVNDIITLQAVTPATIQRMPVDLLQLARSAAEGVQAAAREAGVAVRAHLPPGPVVVVGDLLRLTQVFDNLLANAIKFTERGGRVDLRVLPGAGSVRVEVADTGVGIPAEYAERVFERFYQVDGTLTRRRGGIGLGLAICRLIVEVHGGHMGVESEVGVGSCFYFTLPMQPAESAGQGAI